MGSNCDSKSSPDTTNVCSSKIEENYEIPNFCNITGSLGKSKKKEYCERLSNQNEWDHHKEGESCYYEGVTN